MGQSMSALFTESVLDVLLACSYGFPYLRRGPQLDDLVHRVADMVLAWVGAFEVRLAYDADNHAVALLDEPPPPQQQQQGGGWGWMKPTKASAEGEAASPHAKTILVQASVSGLGGSKGAGAKGTGAGDSKKTPTEQLARAGAQRLRLDARWAYEMHVRGQLRGCHASLLRERRAALERVEDQEDQKDQDQDQRRAELRALPGGTEAVATLLHVVDSAAWLACLRCLDVCCGAEFDAALQAALQVAGHRGHAASRYMRVLLLHLNVEASKLACARFARHVVDTMVRLYRATRAKAAENGDDEFRVRALDSLAAIDALRESVARVLVANGTASRRCANVGGRELGLANPVALAAHVLCALHDAGPDATASQAQLDKLVGAQLGALAARREPSCLPVPVPAQSGDDVDVPQPPQLQPSPGRQAEQDRLITAAAASAAAASAAARPKSGAA
jgi:hypothetical protein